LKTRHLRRSLAHFIQHMSIQAYSAVFRIHTKQALAQPSRVVAQAFMFATRMFFLFVVYSYVYTYVTHSTYPLESALASVLMYNLLLALSLRRVFDVISSDIKTGAFETALLRPMNYLLSVCVAKAGTSIVQAVATAVLLVPLYIFFSPALPHITYLHVVWGVLAVIGGVLVSGALYSLIALPALWINDAEPFYYIVDKTILVLGGSYVPVALFPAWLKAVSEYSPFGSAMFGTRMFDPMFLAEAPRLILTQFVWIGVLTCCVILVFRYALRSVSINGG
jgi:ABC-2 type transport system permease protein